MILDININPSAIDGNALIISVVGYVIVFGALVILSTVFYFIPKILNVRGHLKKKRVSAVEIRRRSTDRRSKCGYQYGFVSAF